MKRKRTIAGVELTPKRLITAAVVVVVLGAVSLLYNRIDVAEWQARAKAMNGPLVFALVTVLPLAGFPASVLIVVAGVRFGTVPGFALSALAILLQLLASYALVKILPGFFQRRFDPLRQRLPKGAYAPVTQFTMLLPGVPYFAKNYVLPIIGVPLRTYLFWGFIIHTAKSVAGLLLGGMSDHLTGPHLAIIIAYEGVVTLVCAWTFRRLRAQLKARPPAADGRKRPA